MTLYILAVKWRNKEALTQLAQVELRSCQFQNTLSNTRNNNNKKEIKQLKQQNSTPHPRHTICNACPNNMFCIISKKYSRCYKYELFSAQSNLQHNRCCPPIVFTFWKYLDVLLVVANVCYRQMRYETKCLKILRLLFLKSTLGVINMNCLVLTPICDTIDAVPYFIHLLKITLCAVSGSKCMFPSNALRDKMLEDS